MFRINPRLIHLELFQNYPNPVQLSSSPSSAIAKASTMIPFLLAAGGHVELSLFNLLGQKVATVFSGYLAVGAERLRQKFSKRDTSEACQIVREVQKAHKVYFIKYADSLQQAKVTIETADGNTYSETLPCTFILPLGCAKIKHLKLETPPALFNFKDDREIVGFRHVLIPVPSGPTPLITYPGYIRFIKCPELLGGLDKPRISIPLTNRKVSHLTTLFGALTAGSFAWYLVENNNADDALARYRAATRLEDVVDLRIQTENARTRCDIAAYEFIGSASVFAILLARDLLRSKPQKSDSLAQIFPH
jgi:hypothetical protein